VQSIVIDADLNSGPAMAWWTHPLDLALPHSVRLVTLNKFAEIGAARNLSQAS